MPLAAFERNPCRRLATHEKLEAAYFLPDKTKISVVIATLQKSRVTLLNSRY